MNKNYFETFDVNLCTALVYSGFTLDTLDRKDINHVKFIFCRVDGMDETIQAYWKGELRVEPQFFSQIARAVKSRLHSEG